jgi:hypothetical protein
MRKARRWATRKAINRHKSAEILEETATEVDASAVSSNGVTGLDFDPRAAISGPVAWPRNDGRQ